MRLYIVALDVEVKTYAHSPEEAQQRARQALPYRWTEAAVIERERIRWTGSVPIVGAARFGLSPLIQRRGPDPADARRPGSI
jgi:hypothetical protein